MSDSLAMKAPRPHCPHCGRGSNFHLPKITIDWDEINRQQFDAHKAGLRAKLEQFMDNDKAAYASSNWFTKGDMIVIDALLQAADARGTDGQSASTKQED